MRRSDANTPPGHYRGQSTSGKAPAKKRVMPVVPAKRLADASSKKSAKKKKKTKKQLTKEASARCREMSAFDKVLGHQNSSASDGKPVRPPKPPECREETQAFTSPVMEGNADTSSPVEPNADADDNEGAAITETGPISNDTAEETRNAVVTISDETESHRKENGSVKGIDDSADEVYSPANDKESDDEDDDGSFEEQKESVELQGNIEESNQLLHSSGGNSPLRSDYVDSLDPNIANAAGQTELGTDGEGAEDTPEADTDANSECDAGGTEKSK
ncbi:hypothetical protein GN958_ATG09231 [Phytophthora infestans]|uniref:Uncharacterized protein n=1 Tax=Phytophthora infestans TaxID=4787 RepID=A0A8S9ULA3_PHYIN|nr:hypothetical protein GN958_ATG09231 [Phytophthora infestans]